MPRFFTDDEGVDWVRAEDVEDGYTAFVKYIAVTNTGPNSFADLEYEVNKYIDEADDSYILEGPIQIIGDFIVQTLVNEDEI